MIKSFSSFLIVVCASAVLASPVAAQEEGGGGGGGGFSGGGGGSGLPSGIDAPRTIPQQFASKLKLDATQRTAVEQLLAEAATAVAAPAQEMLQLRQRLLNAARADRAEDLKAAEEAYATAAVKVALVEAGTFAKVLAQLKPNQQKDAGEAFALLAGLFSNVQSGGGAPRGGMRGPGGGR